MNEVVTKYVKYRGKVVSVDNLKDSSNIRVDVRCKHGVRSVRWNRRHQLCRKCAAEQGVYNTAKPGRKVTRSSTSGGKKSSYKKENRLVDQSMSTQELVCGDRKKIYFLCGQSGAGKTTTACKLTDKFHVINYDNVRKHLITAINSAPLDRPILLDIPSLISTFYKKLHLHHDIEMIFILEEKDIIKDRILSRGGEITNSIDSRYNRMRSLSRKYSSFNGTADEVYNYLCQI